jgi:hypothetical protein
VPAFRLAHVRGQPLGQLVRVDHSALTEAEIPANLRLVVSGRTVKDCHPISTATAATPSAWSTVKGDRS